MKQKKNDIVRVTVSAMTLEGMGVARLNGGFVVFVAQAALGDVCDVLLMKVKKSFAYAKIVRLITPSPERVEDACPNAHLCGGCTFSHISYEAELSLKRDAVYNNLKKLGGADFPELSVIGASSLSHYRNKAQYPIARARDGSVRIGFYRKRSHDVVDIRGCTIEPRAGASVIAAVREYIERTGETVYDEASHEGVLRHVFVREGKLSGEVLAAVVANAERLSNEELLVRLICERVANVSGVVLNINRERTNVIMGERSRVLFGRDELSDTLLGMTFITSHRSFYQVNPEQTERLYTEALSMLDAKPHETVIDLFSGVGTITSLLARDAGRVISVEIIGDAVRLAKKNAALNGLTNCEFYAGDAGKVARRLVDEGVFANALVVDPPRRGLDMAAIDAIATLSPGRIVYVSCDSATLGRDVGILRERGYEARRAVAVDMFPRTGHVETVVLLFKHDAKQP